MKKKVAILLVLLLVCSPYSINIGLLKTNILSADAVELEEVVSPLYEQLISEIDEYEYLPKEVQIIEQINEQIALIEENLEIIQDLDIDDELNEMVQEIQSINLEEIVIEEIRQQNEDLDIENGDVIISSIENKNFSMEEIIDTILIKEGITEDVNKEEIVNAEAEINTVDNLLNEQTTDESLPDLIADMIENENISETTPDSVLINSSISIHIITSDGEENTIQELGEFVEEIVEQSTENQISLINKNTASASSKLNGYFISHQQTIVADMNTKNPKFVNVGTITREGGILKPVDYLIKLENKRNTKRSGSYSLVSTNTVKNAKKGKSYYVESPISATYFWKAYATFTGTFKDGSKDNETTSTDGELLNKKGVPYPIFKDSKSGKVMSEPSSTTWTKKYYPEDWTSKKRSDYLDWYEKKYGKITRTDYEIHHIRPRVYYGSNDYSNLIPLKTSYHRKTVSPWWSNY